METNHTDPLAAAGHHLDQAFALEVIDDFEAALSECDAATQSAQAFLADVYNLRGIVLEGLARHDEALDAYRLALQLAPDLAEAADNLKDLEAELGLSHTPVTIAKFGSTGEAHIARAKLEAEGIWAYVADEWFGGMGMGAVRLQTQETDAAKAQSILGLEDKESVRCPHCHSSNVRMPFLGKEWRCKDCSRTWTL